MGARAIVRIQVFLGFICPLLCQLVGFFTPYWYTENGVSRGLFYQCDTNLSCNTDTGILDQATIGLQGTSLIMLLFVCISGVVSVILYGPDEDGDIDNDFAACHVLNCCCFYCWLVLYPVAGILILCGCIKFGTLYHTEVIGGSFYACVMSGCLIFLMIFVSSCDMCCKRKSENGIFATLLVKIYDDAI